MNRLLVDILSGINALAAGVIIIGSTIGLAVASESTWGLPFGFLIGLILATAFCGFLSLFVLIEEHLRVLADNARSTIIPPAPVAEPKPAIAAPRSYVVTLAD